MNTNEKAVGLASPLAKAIKNYKVSDLEPDFEWNGRDRSTEEHKIHIQNLSESIKEVGIQKPLRGYINPSTGKVRLIDGHCRFEALSLLFEQGWSNILAPVQIESSKDSDANRIISTLVDNSGKPLTPLEISQKISKLVKYGIPPKTIAAVSGQTENYIKSLLTLDQATPRTKDLVRQDAIAYTTAVKQVNQWGADGAEIVIETATNLAQEMGKAATGRFVDQVAEEIYNGTIDPETVNNGSLSKDKSEAAIAVRSKRRRGASSLTAEDILNGNADAEMLSRELAKKQQKEEKRKKDEVVKSGVLLKAQLASILANPQAIEENGEKVKIVLSKKDYESILALLDAGSVREKSEPSETLTEKVEEKNLLFP